MEIKVNIPKNDYVQPTEVRQEVVQAICEAFLKRTASCILHPTTEGNRGARVRTLYVMRQNGKGIGFASGPDSYWIENYGREYIRMNGVEVKIAFKALRDAGYHIFRIYRYGTWIGYVCDKKPYRENGSEVYEFTDFID